MIDIRAIAAFHDNYIWCLIDTEQSRMVVIDPGDAAPVLQALQDWQCELDSVLITHHHPDHIGGLQALLAQHKVPVYGPEGRVSAVTQPLRDGDNISLLGWTFTVMTLPGHTLDHLAYFTRDDTPPRLFCGDTLFSCGCGRLFEGSPAQMLTSLQRLQQLPADTAVYCSHEYTLANMQFALAVEPHNPQLQQAYQQAQALRKQGQATLPTSLQREQQINPFLRYDEPAVIEAAKQHQAGTKCDPLSVFTVLRQWKDNF